MAKRGRPAKLIDLQIKETLSLTTTQFTRLHQKKINVGEVCKNAVMQKLKGPIPKGEGA